MSKRNTIQVIAERYQGELSDSNRKVRFTWRGLPFEAEQISGKHPQFTTWLLSPSEDYPKAWAGLGEGANKDLMRFENPPRVQMTLESSQDKLAKKLGLNREVQIGDQAFDDEVYLDSHVDDEVAARLLPSVAARHAARELLRHSDRVTLVGAAGPVGYLKKGYLLEGPVQGGRYDELLGHLLTLAQHLPPMEIEKPNQLPFYLGEMLMLFSILVCIPVFLLLMGINSWWPTFSSGIDHAAFWGGLGLWLASIPTLWLMMRGRSSSATTFLVTLGALLFALPGGAFGALYALNGVADSSVRPVPGVVEGTHLSRSTKGGTSYYAEVKTDDGLLRGRFSVDSDDYHRYGRGSRVYLHIGEGRLGWSWLDHISGR